MWKKKKRMRWSTCSLGGHGALRHSLTTCLSCVSLFLPAICECVGPVSSRELFTRWIMGGRCDLDPPVGDFLANKVPVYNSESASYNLTQLTKSVGIASCIDNVSIRPPSSVPCAFYVMICSHLVKFCRCFSGSQKCIYLLYSVFVLFQYL